MSKKTEPKEKGTEEEKPKETPAAEEAEPEEAAEEKRVTKPAKKRAEKKRKIGKKICTYYKLSDRNLTRLRPFCERCGQGFFMADHGDRYTCGHCGFSRYKQISSSGAQ